MLWQSAVFCLTDMLDTVPTVIGWGTCRVLYLPVTVLIFVFFFGAQKSFVGLHGGRGIGKLAFLLEKFHTSLLYYTVLFSCRANIWYVCSSLLAHVRSILGSHPAVQRHAVHCTVYRSITWIHVQLKYINFHFTVDDISWCDYFLSIFLVQ